MAQETYTSDYHYRFGGPFETILDKYEKRGWMTRDEAAKMLLTQKEYEDWKSGKLDID